jgi:hypothetical protein
MELRKEEKELLIRAFSFYYEQHVWKDMVKDDNSKASAEDYNIRSLTDKLGIRNMFPMEISSRW